MKKTIALELRAYYIFSGPVKERKRYLKDASLPIPKRTLRWQKKKHENRLTCDSRVEVPEERKLSEVVDYDTTSPSCSKEELSETVCVNESFSSSDSDSYSKSFNETSSEVDTNLSESDFSDLDDSEKEGKHAEINDVIKKTLPAHEAQAFCLVSYILKYNLSASAGKDLLQLLKTLCPESEYFTKLKYDEMFSNISENEPEVVHYCCLCNNRFPDDPDVFLCSIGDCSGLRYTGPLSSQMVTNRQPRCFFIIADVESQLRSLVERNNIWNELQKTKQSVNARTPHISDIIDGEAYLKHCQPGECLHSENAFSAIFNTDGVPLFSSSKVKLWPIFICINELPPAKRFARENTILAALWQGKDKPPFFQYIAAFGDAVSKLHSEGISVQPPGLLTTVNIRLTVLLASVDLQAKAYVANMTMHNGDYGCITCEERGLNVKQGKGSSHYYPYRPIEQKPPMRESDDLKYVKGVQASRKDRIMGICGHSGLLALDFFDMVQGVVPDYMHGVLLGVTKTLMSKWFSSTQSGKPFFIGKHLNQIAKRMGRIQPPDYIERLPRNLEKNYTHFKATELQTWLLYYALPSLKGFLPDVYLEHFACLSEGIHILLRDKISQLDLDRAETLLERFYKDFSQLYGEGSCGLNVHNIGSHLVYYVRLWGPLFCWSCFGFEDSNAELLNAAHGTGCVLKPVLKMKHAQFKIWSLDIHSCEEGPETQFLSQMVPKWRKRWQNLKKCQNCYISGAATSCDFENLDREFILNKTRAVSIKDLKKVKRVKVNSQYLYSKEYSRMNKRICHVVLCKNNNCYSVEYFILNEISGTVYAVGNLLEVQEPQHICQGAGHHLLEVKLTLDVHVFEVDMIMEKLFYITPAENLCLIAKMPNQYGHGVFK